jgi:hypothetical protein
VNFAVWPPMLGGVRGGYCKKLVDSLRREGVQVFVIWNEDGKGDHNGVSPKIQDNSKVLLNIVKEDERDVVHVQYELGLYGIHLDAINPRRTHKYRIILPLVHSSYSYYFPFGLHLYSVDEMTIQMNLPNHSLFQMNNSYNIISNESGEASSY